ncbi:Nicotinamidase-related amidase (PncA) (PDB:1ILW) [Commensalibacter communis]|uniref:cysteine hydrolase family protein n=1 Tax=Commensalibacter communis TaxID=2972786 RepID=UPI0022FF51BC|nr:cysteine hydrolase family protein [Commensalibacter communis]CAI3960429.1 Nicotinamidase-related amidase (PncA) (PDB:1ILW) [Commensalibacter communis]CAI3961312.1 Nicotinamidase-related amidase (PncA) (PDB:1ILW) [Commensalibacter communis]
MRNSVLMIIDLQNDYFPNGKFPLPNIESVSEQSKKILETARENSLPIIHIKHEWHSPEAPFFAHASEGSEINEIVKPLDNEHIVVKNYPNSFKETNVKSILDQHQCKNIIIIGAMAQMCVDATVRAGSDLGYDITVIHDAIAAQNSQFDNMNISAKEVHAVFMNALSLGYATVIDTKEIISQLQK